MKFKLFHFVTLLFIPIISFAQTHFVDSNDMVPIPFVHVISDKGIIIGSTDINGIIDFSKIKALTNHETHSVSFHHISYANEEFKIENLSNTDTIKLKQRDIQLKKN